LPASGDALETELKYLDADLDAVRRRLAEVGARLVSPRALETNAVFDDDAGTLRQTDRLLRLRDGHELTVKMPVQSDRFKSRREITVDVTGDAIEELLRALGYRPTFRYEKYREAWDVDGAYVTLDELPFLGPVVEIEADPELIEPAAERLGLGSSPTSTSNYLALFAQYAREHGLPPGTFMTFEAERGV
jgi:adenylate cyclase class 2